jgi:hypothetical protein
MGMVIANPTARHDALSRCLGSQMGKSGFTNGAVWVLTWEWYFPNQTQGHTGLTEVFSGVTASTSGSQARKVGSQMGKSGFSNGDGDCQSDRQARRSKPLSWFPNGEIWVHKWGNPGSYMGMVIPQSNREVHDMLWYVNVSHMGTAGFRNEDQWVHMPRPWAYSRVVVGSQQVTQG